jgi:hypothetical protein
MRIVRIFVSSPDDAAVERRRIERVAQRLNGAFAGVARIETVRWETSHYTADRGFQEQIPAPDVCDMVLAVFKAKLGTPLPLDKFTMPTGEPYPSGTGYQVLTAIEGAKASALPDVFVFRQKGAPAVALDDPAWASCENEWTRLKAFFARFFVNGAEWFEAAFW